MNSKNIIMLLGIGFVVVGLLGFVNDPVLGMFEVNASHNLIHIVSGILAIIFGLTSETAAQNFAKVFGAAYAIIALLGFLSPDNMLLGFIEINNADNFLHLLLAAIFLYIGFAPDPFRAKGGFSTPRAAR